MDQKTFTFGSFANLPEQKPDRVKAASKTSSSYGQKKSSRSLARKSSSNTFGATLSSTLDENPVISLLYTELPSDAKFRDVFWNRVVLRQFHETYQDDSSISHEQFYDLIDLFREELTYFAKHHQFDKIIRTSQYFYSIGAYIFSQYGNEAKFVKKWMNHIVSEAFVDAMMLIVKQLKDSYKNNGFKYSSKELHTSHYIEFLRLFTGLLFMAARCGCAKRIHKNLMEKFRWTLMSTSQDFYGSNSGYQWTWVLVTLACLETASESVLPLYLEGRKNILQWILSNICVNHDALPYFCIVFHKLHHVFHERDSITDDVVHSLLNMYFEEQTHKIYFLPLIKRLFCDEKLRVYRLDADDYYFTFEQSLSQHAHLKDFLSRLDYYDASDRSLLLSAFSANKELLAWYWHHSESVPDILEGCRKATMTATAVARFNFLHDLLSLPMSTLPEDSLDRISVRDFEAYVQDMIYHPKWKAASHGDKLFLFPGQSDFSQRVSIRISSLSVLHRFYGRYVALENYVNEYLSDHDQYEVLLASCRKVILKHFLLPFGSFVKMVDDPNFLYRWERVAHFKTHHWSSQSYHYVAALALKLMPYYMRYFPNDEHKLHYDVIASRMPIGPLTIEAWSQMLSQAKVALDWTKREILFPTNYLINSHPSWYNQGKMLFKEDALLSSTVTPAELYFWNRSFFKHSVIRFNDFYLKAQSSALQQNTTIEQITFNNPTHSHKFTIIGTMKAILSVSTRSEASDFLSRMGFSEHKYPEIGMYLSAPSPHKKIDPSLSTFEVNSLQAASIWKLSYRIGLVPLFDVVAKLDEIHSFALDLSDLSIFWRVCYDICHVVSIFDLIYIHGLKKLKIMLQDLSFNCLMIHLDRCLHQDTLMTLLYDDIFSAASLALEREPLFMLPFYCTQILHNLTRCHPSAFGLHQQLLLQTLRMAINRGDLECDFSRVFRDQLNLEKLFVRDSRTGVMVLTLLQRSLQHKLLSGSHIVVELSALLKKFEYNSHYKSRIGKILSESHEDENSATEDTSSSAKPVKPHKDTLEDDFDFYFGDQKEEDVVRDLALLKKDTPHMDEEESSDDEMELNASDSDSDGKIAPRKERDGSPSSVAASESESEQLENKPLSKKEKKRKKKKKSKKAAKSTEDTSSDEEHDKKEKKKRKKKKAKKRKAVSDSDEEKEKKSSKKSNKKTSKKRKRTSDSDEEKSARKSKKRRKIKKD